MLAQMDLAANQVILLEIDRIQLIRQDNGLVSARLIEYKSGSSNEDILKHRGRAKALFLNESCLEICSSEHEPLDRAQSKLLKLLQEVELHLNFLIACAEYSMAKNLICEVDCSLRSVAETIESESETKQAQLLKSALTFHLDKTSWYIKKNQLPREQFTGKNLSRIFRGAARRQKGEPYKCWVILVGVADESIYSNALWESVFAKELGGFPDRIIILSTMEPEALNLRETISRDIRERLRIAPNLGIINDTAIDDILSACDGSLALMFLETPRVESRRFLSYEKPLFREVDIYAIAPYSELHPRTSGSLRSGNPTLFFIGRLTDFGPARAGDGH